jgi:hypothetical protein
VIVFVINYRLHTENCPNCSSRTAVQRESSNTDNTHALLNDLVAICTVKVCEPR